MRRARTWRQRPQRGQRTRARQQQRRRVRRELRPFAHSAWPAQKEREILQSERVQMAVESEQVLFPPWMRQLKKDNKKYLHARSEGFSHRIVLKMAWSPFFLYSPQREELQSRQQSVCEGGQPSHFRHERFGMKQRSAWLLDCLDWEIWEAFMYQNVE